MKRYFFTEQYGIFIYYWLQKNDLLYLLIIEINYLKLK